MLENWTDDIIALALCIVVIPLIWVLDGRDMINLSDIVIGATISGWTLILNKFIGKVKNGQNK